MKRLILIIVILLGVKYGFTQSYSVEITMRGIRDTGCDVVLCVFEDGNLSFKDSDLRQRVYIRPTGRTTYHNFELAKGRYVFVAYQDINGNGKIDTNIFGKPKEPFAISNDINFPSYRAAEVDIKSNCSVILDF